MSCNGVFRTHHNQQIDLGCQLCGDGRVTCHAETHDVRSDVAGQVKRERMRTRKFIGGPLACSSIGILNAILDGDPFVLLVIQCIAREESKQLDKGLQILPENPTTHDDDLSARSVKLPTVEIFRPIASI